MSDRLSPIPVPGLSEVMSITTGGIHSCAVTVYGAGYCWGGNGRGQLGIGTVTGGEKSPREIRGPR